jgi:DNA polymerase-3 subunit epsilon
MKLHLTKPLIFFDLETTGIDIVNDRIVEISYLKIYPNGREESKTIRVKPEIPIPQQAIDVHGITNEDVANCPLFKEIAKEIVRDFEGCDLAGYNSNRFDIPLLAEELLRANCDIDLARHNFVDVQVIFHKMEQRTLSAAYKFYCGKNLEDAHSAEADTAATCEILQAQLDRYPELENSVEALSKLVHNNNLDFAGRIIKDDKGEAIFNFGKYKGKKVLDVLKNDSGYYSWIMTSDFALHTKKVLTNIKLSNFGKKTSEYSLF